LVLCQLGYLLLLRDGREEEGKKEEKGEEVKGGSGRLGGRGKRQGG
jgi:hypothetical protein